MQCGFMDPGEIRDLQRYALPQAFGDDLYLRGIYRLNDTDCNGRSSRIRGRCSRGSTRARLPSSPADDVDVLEAAWIAPLMRALAAGAIARLEIVIDCWSVTVARHALLKFWRGARVPAQWAAMLTRTIRRRERLGRRSAGGRSASAVATPVRRARRASRERPRPGTRISCCRSASLDGITAAVELLCAHFAKRSAIVVIGDFDADGATSTALVVRQLRRLGLRVDRLPRAEPLPVRLRAHARDRAAGRAGQAGADHHRRQRRLESRRGRRGARARHRHADHRSSSGAADAAVRDSARQSECAGQFVPEQGARRSRRRVLSDGGADPRDADARPACAATRRLRICSISSRSAPSRISCRSIATIACSSIRDCGASAPAVAAPACARCSKPRIACPRPCLAADLGFQVGPRLNAAGRLDDMSIGIQCLLTDDLDAARGLAARLAQLNQDRRELELQMQQEAMLAIADMRAEDPALPLGLCLFDETWHQGVVGLVASRVKDRVHRPVIALARADATTLKGSARSVVGRAHPRRARCRHGAASGTDREVRRSRDGSRADAARRGARRISRGIRCRGAALDDHRGRRRRRALRRRAQRQRAHDRRRAAAAVGRAVGPGVSRAGVRRLFPGPRRPRRRRAASASWICRTARAALCEAIAFRHFDDEDAPEVRPDARVELAYRLDVNQYNGLEKVQLVVEYLRVL